MAVCYAGVYTAKGNRNSNRRRSQHNGCGTQNTNEMNHGPSQSSSLSGFKATSIAAAVILLTLAMALIFFYITNTSKLRTVKELKEIGRIVEAMTTDLSKAEIACLAVETEICSLHYVVHGDYPGKSSHLCCNKPTVIRK